MEVDAAGNGRCRGLLETASRGALRPSSTPGRNDISPRVTCRKDVRPGLAVPHSHLQGRTWGADSHPFSYSSTFSSPQRDGLRSDWECFCRSSSPCHSQHLRPLDPHALPGGATYAG